MKVEANSITIKLHGSNTISKMGGRHKQGDGALYGSPIEGQVYPWLQVPNEGYVTTSILPRCQNHPQHVRNLPFIPSLYIELIVEVWYDRSPTDHQPL